MNKYDYFPPCSKSVLSRLYREKMHTYREIAVILEVSVKRIQTAMKYFGIVPRKAAPRNQQGENNANWKGDTAGYSSLHRRLYSNQPDCCEECGTTDKDKTYDWANLTGNYSDPKDYKRMCRSCHCKHDGTIENIRKGRKCG